MSTEAEVYENLKDNNEYRKDLIKRMKAKGTLDNLTIAESCFWLDLVDLFVALKAKKNEKVREVLIKYDEKILSHNSNL